MIAQTTGLYYFVSDKFQSNATLNIHAARHDFSTGDVKDVVVEVMYNNKSQIKCLHFDAFTKIVLPYYCSYYVSKDSFLRVTIQYRDDVSNPETYPPAPGTKFGLIAFLRY